METPVLLAFHGLRGVGKDTTIQFVQDWVAKSDPTLSVVRRGFADKMKWAYMRMWVPDCTQEFAIRFIDQYKNNPDAVCMGVLTDTTNIGDQFIPGISFRDHMDQFATESARDIYGEDHWVDMLLPQQDPRHVEGWRESFMTAPKTTEDWPYSIADICCINDLRAENEVMRVKSIPNSLCVKIKRRDREAEVRAQYAAQGRDIHLFAQELPDGLFDVIIHNDDNNMDNAYLRTKLMMGEIERSGVQSIKRGHPLPWEIQ